MVQVKGALNVGWMIIMESVHLDGPSSHLVALTTSSTRAIWEEDLLTDVGLILQTGRKLGANLGGPLMPLIRAPRASSG